MSEYIKGEIGHMKRLNGKKMLVSVWPVYTHIHVKIYRSSYDTIGYGVATKSNGEQNSEG